LVSNWFYAVAAAMLAVALALLLVPMVRHGRKHGRSRAMFTVAVVVAVVVPLASVGLYRVVGTPATLDGVEPPKEMTVGQAVDALKARLAANPGDVEGWLLLGQTYTMVKQPADARDAYDGALKADPKNVPAMVGWAEADSLARADHRFEGRSLSLLEQAVAAQPDSQKALWLLGIAQFQQEHYTDAAATWRKLQPLLDPDSNVAHAVAEQITLAEKRAAGATQ
jgi:cytochrome c-type biogenesis protein CcmH